jgi:hypothetical protein
MRLAASISLCDSDAALKIDTQKKFLFAPSNFYRFPDEVSYKKFKCVSFPEQQVGQQTLLCLEDRMEFCYLNTDPRRLRKPLRIYSERQGIGTV